MKKLIVLVQIQEKGLLATCNKMKGFSSFGFDWGQVKNNFSKHIDNHYPKETHVFFALDLVSLFEEHPIFTTKSLAYLSKVDASEMTEFKIGNKHPTEEQSIQILRGLHEFSNTFYNRLPKY